MSQFRGESFQAGCSGSEGSSLSRNEQTDLPDISTTPGPWSRRVPQPPFLSFPPPSVAKLRRAEPRALSLPGLRATRPRQSHPPGHPYMDTFRRLFSCGPIFAKKSEEEEGDAAKEVPVPPPCMCSAASHARRCCRSRPPLHCRRFRARALRSWHRHTLCTGCASVRARRCRCRRQPRRRSTTRRLAQVSAPTLPARSRPRSRPPARRLVRQRAQRCVFLAKPCTAHALTPDQWCAALAADAAAERRDAQPVF